MVSWLVISVCPLAYIAGLQTLWKIIFYLIYLGLLSKLHSLQLSLPKLEIAGTFLAGIAKSAWCGN